jgi:hypothetical protein
MPVYPGAQESAPLLFRVNIILLQFSVCLMGVRVDSSSRFVPGSVAPRSGVYRVHHYAHRMPHFVTITAGAVLPECKRCGDKVRFAPMIAAEPINADVDFIDQDFAA